MYTTNQIIFLFLIVFFLNRVKFLFSRGLPRRCILSRLLQVLVKGENLLPKLWMILGLTPATTTPCQHLLLRELWGTHLLTGQVQGHHPRQGHLQSPLPLAHLPSLTLAPSYQILTPGIPWRKLLQHQHLQLLGQELPQEPQQDGQYSQRVLQQQHPGLLGGQVHLK